MKTNLKDNICIEGFDSRIYVEIAALNKQEDYKLMYTGKTSEVSEEFARECIESRFGETKIGNDLITTYKNYSGYSSRLYPHTVTFPISRQELDRIWKLFGRQLTKYFHLTAKESIQSACESEYCIIYRENL